MFKLILILLLVNSIISYKIEDREEGISHAIFDVIAKYLDGSRKTIDVIFGPPEKLEITQSSKDVLDKILMKFTENSVRLIKPSSLNETNVILCFIKNAWDFHLFNHYLLNQLDISNEISILTYCDDCENLIQTTSVPSILPSLLRNNLLLTATSKGYLQLRRLESCITAQYCDLSNWPTINTFNVTSKLWMKPLSIEKEYKNLNGGELVFGISTQRPIIRYKLFDNNTRIEVKGVSPDIVRLLEKKFNFTTFYQPFEFGEQNGNKRRIKIIAVNKTVKHMHTWLHIDRIGRNFPAIGYPGYSYSRPFMMLKPVVIYTPNTPYSSYEKMLWPFSMTTWIFLISTFIIAVITILIVNRTNKNVQYLFYGKGVSMPTYNVASIFFGISLTRLPMSDFARYLFIIFTMFCLIFRTAYQSLLVEYMTLEQFNPIKPNVDNFLKQNYTIYFRALVKTNENIIEKVIVNKTSDFIVNSVLIGNNKELNRIFSTQCRNSSAKMFMFLTATEYYTLKRETNEKCQWLTIESKNDTFNSFGAFPGNFFFLHMLNELFDEIIPNGIAQHIVSHHFSKNYDVIEKNTEIEQLTLNDLSFGFIVWIISFIPAIIVFLIELKLKWRWKRAEIVKKKFAKVHPIDDDDDIQIIDDDFETISLEEEKCSVESKSSDLITEIDSNHETSEILDI